MARIGILCGMCRQDFHCGKCACCMPEKSLKRAVNKIKKFYKPKKSKVKNHE